MLFLVASVPILHAHTTASACSTGNGKGACASFPRCLRGWLHGVLWTGMYLVNHGKSASATLPTQQEFTLLFHVQTLCVAGYFNCIKRNPFLVAVILHSHNNHSLSPATCSPAAPLSEFANVCSWFIWVGKVRHASWPIPASLLQQHSCQNLCLLAVSIAPKGILLLTQWHCIRITVLSPATCHPVQRRPNMRVADCSTVWVCKRLQLMYLSALHLTLFDIYSTTVHSNKKNVSVKRVCLSAMAIYEGLEFFVEVVICPKASQMIGFGSSCKQTGWPCSNHGSHRQSLLRSSWNWIW